MWVYEAYGGGTAAVTPDGSPVEQEVTGLAAVEAMLNLEAPCEFANLFAGSGGYLIYVLPTVTDARRAEIVELARNVAPELPFGGFGDAVASRAEATLLIQEIQGLDPSLLGADFLGASMNLDGVVVADAFGPELDLSLDEIRAQLIDLLAYDPGAGLVIEEPNVAIGT
ncbi:MAG: hypothetical protein GY929_15050 [Actinomycetia bacterium]|nr:hypothetical protein [Actinomycetes bacterium]